ncbi:MAG: GlsB/YeaQ/YmgE family stress response membrane protein [Catenulisporales bacterium]|jgi:uncharacterized membrane protein YeaQ/YmgE (transglycosylase-associated protein family)|nr:GlsB/YeaQ/YmgE family stress response membrane protein [Catenulisporales bacterium]
MFQLLWILIVGLILGALARLILSGNQDIPVWLTVLAGVGGAWLGNGVAGWIGVNHTGGVDWIRHALQLGLAVALVALVSSLWAGRSTVRR